MLNHFPSLSRSYLQILRQLVVLSRAVRRCRLPAREGVAEEAPCLYCLPLGNRTTRLSPCWKISSVCSAALSLYFARAKNISAI